VTIEPRVLDFTNVTESNASKKHLPSGEYLARISGVREYVKTVDDVPTVFWVYLIQLEEHRSATYEVFCDVSDASKLWKIRSLFLATGKVVPKSKVRLNAASVVGLLLGVTLGDTEYKERLQSEVVAWFPSTEVSSEPSVSPAAEAHTTTAPPARKETPTAPAPAVEDDFVDLEEI